MSLEHQAHRGRTRAPPLTARRVRDLAEFGALVAPFLTRDPVGHSVLATSLDTVCDRDPGADVLWWVLEEATGSAVAVGQHHLPHGCGLHGVPDELASAAAAPLVDLLLAERRDVPRFAGRCPSPAGARRERACRAWDRSGRPSTSAATGTARR